MTTISNPDDFVGWVVSEVERKACAGRPVAPYNQDFWVQKAFLKQSLAEGWRLPKGMEKLSRNAK
jgi:hypothetical protein